MAGGRGANIMAGSGTNNGARIGIDLGGTKTEVVVIDGDGGEIFRHREPTPGGDYAATIDTIAALVARAERVAGTRFGAVGVGVPGSLSPATGLIRNANSTCLNGHPLDRDIAAALGRPVVLENDANCFALAEAKAGAGRGFATVFGIILGTGVGAGVVTDGRIMIGRNRIGGEWGHNALPSPGAGEVPGPDCYCGRQGCVETWCSGPAMMHDHRRLGGQGTDPAALVQAASEGDEAARGTLARHLDRLARSLAAVVNILDPDAIVLGGGLSQIEALYSGLPIAMAPHIFSDTFETPILRNVLGDSAGVVGAAWLCPQ